MSSKCRHFITFDNSSLVRNDIRMSVTLLYCMVYMVYFVSFVFMRVISACFIFVLILTFCFPILFERALFHNCSICRLFAFALGIITMNVSSPTSYILWAYHYALNRYMFTPLFHSMLNLADCCILLNQIFSIFIESFSQIFLCEFSC